MGTFRNVIYRSSQVLTWVSNLLHGFFGMINAALPVAALRTFDKRMYMTLDTGTKRHVVEERMCFHLINHALYGALPPLLAWCKPAGSTMPGMEMSPRYAPLDCYFRDAGGNVIPDENAENKGSHYNLGGQRQGIVHTFKYFATFGGTPAQIKHACASTAHGNQPTFIHLHGIHYTFIFVMRSKYLSKKKLHKKFAGGSTGNTIGLYSNEVARTPFVDKVQAALWCKNYPVSRAQEWHHIMANVQRFAHSETNPSTPWTAADVEYHLTPVWAIECAA